VSIENYDSRVIPDLSAHCNIVLQHKADILQVPLAGVRDLGSGKGEVWVKTGDKFERREIALGERSNMTVAVAGGLAAGEEVRLN